MTRVRLSGRKLAIILLFGFSSGFPLALTGSLLQAWMAHENVNLKLIGLFSLVGLPYGFKFLWSPLLDRYMPPVWGRRRGWIVIFQLALIAMIAAMATMRPAVTPALTAAVALLISFFSASQDIVIDAYRTEVLSPDELGPGAALHTTGYRIAMIVSGAVALILSDHLPFQVVYLLMAASMGVGLIGSLVAPEPSNPGAPPKSLQDAIIKPFFEFFKRRHVFEVLGFLIFYKLDVIMAVALTTPFMLSLGFTATDIGTVTKGFGLLATIFGTLAGGALMPRLGMYGSLWAFGLFQGVSNLTFMLLAHVGHHYPLMATSIALENFCSGMGNAAYLAFMMSLCDRRYTATQFALISSLMAQSRVWGGAPTGYLVSFFGWEKFFLLCTLMAAPGLLLLSRYPKWKREGALAA